MSDTSQLPENLKKALTDKGLTAADLSRECGVSLATLSRVLSGQVNPSFGNMVKISEALGLSLDHLAGKAEKPSIQEVKNTGFKAPTQSLAPDYANETDVLVSYQLDNTTLTPSEAAKQMLSAANGSFSDVWAEKFIKIDAFSRVRAIMAMQVGTGKVSVDLAFPDAYFESGSIASLIGVVGAAIAGTNARVMDIRIPTSLIRTFPRTGRGIAGIHHTYNKTDRPLLCATIRPMIGLTPKLYAQMVYETLLGGVDLTCDPTMMHNIPYNDWYARLPFIREACLKAHEERDGEYLDHVINISAATVEEMTKRIEKAMEFNFTHFLVDSAAVGWTALQSLTIWAQGKGILISAMGSRSMQTAALSEQVLAKLLRFVGCDVVSTPSPLNNNIGGRRQVKGIISSLRDENIEAQDDYGLTFDQPTLGLPASMPACGGGHNPWHFTTLVETLGNDAMIQCGGTVFSHPKGPLHGASANRHAVEILAHARNKGVNIAVEGRALLLKAAEEHEDLKTMLGQWKEGAFLFGVVKNNNEGISAEIKRK